MTISKASEDVYTIIASEYWWHITDYHISCSKWLSKVKVVFRDESWLFAKYVDSKKTKKAFHGIMVESIKLKKIKNKSQWEYTECTLSLITHIDVYSMV